MLRSDCTLLSHLTLLFTLAALALGLAVPPAVAQSADDEHVVYDSSHFDALEYRMIGPYRGGRSTAVTGIAG
ncbi:MAG: hypothetical protein BRD26_05090, partial [Bacteroidetes bacterium QH_1_64_81]